MLEAAGNFGSGFDWVFGGLADAWDLVGLERRDFVAVSKLSFVVQPKQCAIYYSIQSSIS